MNFYILLCKKAEPQDLFSSQSSAELIDFFLSFILHFGVKSGKITNRV